MDLINNIIKALSCSDLWRFVLNDCECHSKCFEFCDFGITTHKVDIPEEHEQTHPDVSIGVGDFHMRRKYSKNNDK